MTVKIQFKPVIWDSLLNGYLEQKYSVLLDNMISKSSTFPLSILKPGADADKPEYSCYQWVWIHLRITHPMYTTGKCKSWTLDSWTGIRIAVITLRTCAARLQRELVFWTS